MNLPTCPNCHQTLTPGDDICENCGAVLVPAPTPARLNATPAISPANTLACPNCHQPITQGDDICEHCGAVLAGVAGSALPAASAPATACPNCHAPHQVNARFCNQCGFNFVLAGPPQPEIRTAAPTPAGRLKLGSVLNGKYTITNAIGSGGMGAVYLAEDQLLKRPVVIKALLSSDDPDLVAQSVKEREFLAAIKHANIVAIYDFFTVGTEGYIVMEYVQGKTLYQIIEDQGGPLAVPDAIGYILGILPAFTYLAKLELVYCDFKPQNVMLEALKDGSRIVKLIDLGTVIKYESHPEDVYGTAGFFAPEAVRAPSNETDLYSICRTLAWMVTLMELDDPPFGMPPSEHYKAFRDHPALYRLLVKGTHPNPERRFHSADDLGDQLAGVLRLIVGGAPGMLVPSRLFITNTLAATGRLGALAEAILDERDPAIDLLRYGDQALRSGNSAGAIGFYTQAIGANPHSVDGYLRLADALIERGEVVPALAEITKAQRVAPGNWKIAWYTGRVLEAQGDLAAAADQYNELIGELPGELPPRQALARVRARQGDDTTAMGFYADVLRADPGNIEAILGLTASLLNLQRWDEVARVLSGVSEAAAKYVEAQLMLCDLFLYRITPLTPQNVLRAAQAVHALSGRTEDPRSYLARGDVYRAARQLARAKQLPANMTLPGLIDTSERSLGFAAEASYTQYLRAAQNPPNREEIIRRRFEVAPWRLF